MTPSWRICCVAVAALLLLTLHQIEACPELHITSPLLPFIEGEYALGFYAKEESGDVLYSYNGRPIYVSEESPTRYLYHMQLGEDHGGRWLVGSDVGHNSAWAFIQSWALSPPLIPLISDRATWQVFGTHAETGEGMWSEDVGLSIECHGVDQSVYLGFSHSPALSGLYVETGRVEDGRPVLVNGDLQLYASGCCAWIVGEEVGDGHGLAYVEAQVTHPAHIPQSSGHEWHVAVDDGWLADHNVDVISSDNSHCVEALLRRRSAMRGNESSDHTGEEDLSAIHEYCGRAQTTFQVLQMLRVGRKGEVGPNGSGSNAVELWNGVPIPLIGFGTGAMVRQDCEGVISMALQSGYRLLDTATAYDNEDVIGELLSGETALVPREEVFLMSKLWFSELGFEETLSAADRSLQRLRTIYLDSYLIHWPQCYPEVSWMDCESASSGTWQQSYRALEKLYAEGKVLSIGVSNFNGPLLLELLDFASTTPHVVQNHHDVANQDLEVLDLCRSFAIFYQAYSSLRTFTTGPHAGLLDYEDARGAVSAIALRNNVTPAQVVLRWQVQQGIGVIPRSHRPEHALENLQVLGFELSEEDMAMLTHEWQGVRHHNQQHAHEHEEL